MFAPHAGAVDLSIGATAGAAQGHTDCLAAQPCDHSGGFGRLEATGRFDGGLEVNASYFHAGTFKGRDQQDQAIYGGDFQVGAVGLTAGYAWRFEPAWRLQARAGVAGVRTHFRYDDPFSGTADKTTLQPLAGVGLAYTVTPSLDLGVDYDETRFIVHESRGPLRMLGVSIQYKF
jgi:opacity protein-like surface antigen